MLIGKSWQAAPLLLLMACGAAPQSGVVYPDEPKVVFTERNDMTPKPRGDERLRQAMLDAHNNARREVGVGPLVWNAALADYANAYALKLAASGKFEHDRQEGVTPRQGENLWMGTRDAFTHTEMAQGWVDEKRFYKAGIFPDNSKSGNWSDVGHYTQIIWKGTKSVGCAVASNTRNDYLVCRYAPAGNMVGKNPVDN